MTTQDQGTGAAPKEMTLQELQEQALHLELDIQDSEGNPLNEEQLEDLILDKLAKDETARAKREAEEADAAIKQLAAEELASSNERAPGPAPRRALRPGAGLEPKQLTAEQLEKFKLSPPTELDRLIAQHFGYPVVIPGGRAYRVTKSSVRCAYGGGERKVGEIILLTDAHVRNKREYVEEIEDQPSREEAAEARARASRPSVAAPRVPSPGAPQKAAQPKQGATTPAKKSSKKGGRR